VVKLSEHKGGRFVKFIYIGDSGTGKTGSLASLALAGYKLRVLDMDNGLSSLREYIAKDDPAKLELVDYETRRDKYKSGPGGPVIAGQPRAYVEATKLMTQWSDGTIPAEWGEDTIFVLDSLTHFSNAAFEWAKGMNPLSREPRQWYSQAQKSIETVLALLTSEAFEANVVVISHVKYIEQNGVLKGVANSIGQALGPIIPSYFNTMMLAEMAGSGKNVRRVIKTRPTNLIALKNPAPFKVQDTYPLETGMIELFNKLKTGEKS